MENIEIDSDHSDSKFKNCDQFYSIKVVEGRNIVIPQVDGISLEYCSVTWGEEDIKLNSCSGDLMNPTFNGECSLHNMDNAIFVDLYCVCNDEDVLVGSCLLPSPMLESGACMDGWHSIKSMNEGKGEIRGELHIVIQSHESRKEDNVFDDELCISPSVHVQPPVYVEPFSEPDFPAIPPKSASTEIKCEEELEPSFPSIDKPMIPQKPTKEELELPIPVVSESEMQSSIQENTPKKGCSLFMPLKPMPSAPKHIRPLPTLPPKPSPSLAKPLPTLPPKPNRPAPPTRPARPLPDLPVRVARPSNLEERFTKKPLPALPPKRKNEEKEVEKEAEKEVEKKPEEPCEIDVVEQNDSVEIVTPK